jgi:hypothetical protein
MQPLLITGLWKGVPPPPPKGPYRRTVVRNIIDVTTSEEYLVEKPTVPETSVRNSEGPSWIYKGWKMIISLAIYTDIRMPSFLKSHLELCLQTHRVKAPVSEALASSPWTFMVVLSTVVTVRKRKGIYDLSTTDCDAIQMLWFHLDVTRLAFLSTPWPNLHNCLRKKYQWKHKKEK